MVAPDAAAVQVGLVGDGAASLEAILPDDVAATVLDADAFDAVDGIDCLLATHDGPGSAALAVLDGRASGLPVIAVVTGDGRPGAALSAGAADYVDRDVAESEPSILASRVRAAAAESRTGTTPATEWYEALLENSTDLLTVIDESGEIRYQSPSSADAIGYPAADLVGEDAFAYVHESDLERVAETFAALVEGGPASIEEVQYRFRQPDGEWVWMESVARNRLDSVVGGYVIASRVITERKEKDRRLAELETVLEVMPDTMVITDTDGYHREIHGFEGWSGYEPEELLGEHVSKTTPDADLERGAEVVADLIRSDDRTTATYETHIETKDGELVPFENHIALLPPDEDGRIPGSVSVLRDISERKERERRLEQAETIFQNAQDAIFLVDITDDDRYEIRRINRSYEETTGMAAEDLQGRTPREIFGDEIGTNVEARFRECVERGEPLDYEERLDLPGLPPHWHTRLAPVTVDDDVVGIVGATRNVTERKEREAELELKNRAMDEAPIGITIADATRPSRPIVYANEGFATLTGYDELDIQGRNLSALAGPETDDREFGELERAMDRAESATMELLLHRADGSPVWTRVSVAPVTDDGGDPTHIVGFQQDISQRKEYETEIERRFDEFGELLTEELGEPIERARSELSAALEDLEDTRVESAAESLERTDRLLEDLTTVHSFGAPSREVSEATLLGSRGLD
jgi:PAS domain S-box-containing protein